MAGLLSRRKLWLLVGVLVLIRVVTIANALAGPQSRGHDDMFGFDSQRYHAIAESRGRPYRDFQVEFPPVTLGTIELINGHDLNATVTRLAWSQLVADLLVAAALGFGWGRRAAIMYLLIGVAFLVYPFIYFRIDLVSVALATWGLALVRRRFEGFGGGVLALSVLAKLWPIALVPLLFVRRQSRAVVGLLAVGGVGGVLWLAWSGLAGPREVLTFRGTKGWQIESVVGSIVRPLTGDHMYYQAGAMRVGHAPAWASPALGVSMLATVALVWWLVARVQHAPALVTDGLGPIAAVTAFLVFAPILSPQYLIWLLPFVAIAAALGDRGPAAVLVTAWLITVWLFESRRVIHTDPLSEVVLLLRNGVLVALLVWTIVRIARAGRPELAETVVSERVPVPVAATV